MTISTEVSTDQQQPTLTIVNAFIDTSRGGRKDVVTVLERDNLGFHIRAQAIGNGAKFEHEAIAHFQKQFPTAVCECKI